jgi:hypothetical protein
VTIKQATLLALKEFGRHVGRRWYVYATFIVLFAAPFPVVLTVMLGWLGYFNYRVLTLKKKKDTL